MATTGIWFARPVAQLTTLGSATLVDIWWLCRVAVFLVVELVAGMVGVSFGDGLLGGGTEDCGLLGGCEGINFTPAYPFTARLMATLFLD